MASPARRLVESDSWLDRVGDSFMRALLREELQPRTVQSYGVAVKDLFAFLREHGVDDFHYLTRELLAGWQDSLRERRPPLKASSRATYATSVRRLIAWAAESDIVDLKLQLAVKGVRVRRDGPHERQPLSDEDLAALIAHLAPARGRTTVIDLRDRALFFFFLYTGLRVSEALQVTRFNYMKGRVRQKGGTWVEFHVPPLVASFIEEYLRARVDDEPWLWLRHGNNVNVSGRLEDSGVREIWRRLCLRVGIPPFVTHQLRHTAGTRVYEETGSTRAVAEWLNHADERTAHRYVKVSVRRKQDTAEKMESFITSVVSRAQLLQRRMPPGGRPRYR